MRMNKKGIFIIVSLLIIICGINCFFYKDTYCMYMNSNYKERKINLGYYSYYPYYYKDKKGNVHGYYHELLDTLCSNLNIDYDIRGYDEDWLAAGTPRKRNLLRGIKNRINIIRSLI